MKKISKYILTLTNLKYIVHLSYLKGLYSKFFSPFLKGNEKLSPCYCF